VKTEETPPITAHKHYNAASAFKPENLLREARRQKNLPEAPVPEICILDPDGDMVRYLCNAGLADRHPGWACYHTDLYVFRESGYEYGILGSVVGAALRSSSPRSCSRPAAAFRVQRSSFASDANGERSANCCGNFRSSPGRHGPQMLHSAKRRRRSTRQRTPAFLQSRWRRQRSTLLRGLAIARCFALHT
jgi:hypothetical protein